MLDRLSIRTRPPGWPVMYQSWGTLLFLHGLIAAERLRSPITPRLSLDTFEGRAWVSVTPFTMRSIRPVLLPPLRVVSQSHELNVRTYVHVNGVPGIWVFSLDASNTSAVLGARVARFEGTWARGEPLPLPPPDSLEFFLVERYCLYTVHWGRLYRVRIMVSSREERGRVGQCPMAYDSPRHDRLCWVSQHRAEKRSYRRRFKAREPNYRPLETLTAMGFEIDHRGLTNRVGAFVGLRRICV